MVPGTQAQVKPKDVNTKGKNLLILPLKDPFVVTMRRFSAAQLVKRALSSLKSVQRIQLMIFSSLSPPVAAALMWQICFADSPSCGESPGNTPVLMGNSSGRCWSTDTAQPSAAA